MRTRTTIMLAAGLVLAALATAATWTVARHTRETLQAQYRDKARLMLESMRAIRNQAREVVQVKATALAGPDGFIPELQSSSYMANAAFARLTNENRAGVTFRTASIKPRNPKNMATEAESEIIALLDALDKGGQERPTWEGVRRIDGADYLVLAVGEVNKASCMKCHGRPENAPKAMRDQYPLDKDQGYGRLQERVESAEIATVSLTALQAQIWQATSWTAGSFLTVGLLLLLGLWTALGKAFAPAAEAASLARLIAKGQADKAQRCLTAQEAAQERAAGPEAKDLFDAVRAMAELLSNVLIDLRSGGMRILGGASRLAGQAADLEASAAQQAASANEVTATSRQISRSSHELAQTMTQVGDTVGEAASMAEAVRTGVGDRERSLRLLTATTALISKRLSVINDKATNINSIITTIAKIADQTNLLSLNAAIEAEKAGDFGKGFSVVAREIRRLADQTALAAEDIEVMVQEMHSAVSQGVMEMDKYQEDVRGSVDVVVGIGRRLEEIMAKVGGLGPKFEEVAGGMNAQAVSADQISQAMASLAETVMHTNETVREFRAVTDALDLEARTLRETVDRLGSKE